MIAAAIDAAVVLVTDEQIRGFEPGYAALGSDKMLSQQGYATNDAWNAKKVGLNLKSLMLADYGWGNYATTIDTTSLAEQMLQRMERQAGVLERAATVIVGGQTVVVSQRGLTVSPTATSPDATVPA